MAQKGEEMTDTQVRLMERIERTTAELVRIRTLCAVSWKRQQTTLSRRCSASPKNATHTSRRLT